MQRTTQSRQRDSKEADDEQQERTGMHTAPHVPETAPSGGIGLREFGVRESGVRETGVTCKREKDSENEGARLLRLGDRWCTAPVATRNAHCRGAAELHDDSAHECTSRRVPV
jgi:hypothetical protein